MQTRHVWQGRRGRRVGTNAVLSSDTEVAFASIDGSKRATREVALGFHWMGGLMMQANWEH
jgi:hypothetical protein